ncbi:MAG TPA: hypothetical protein VIH43_04770 [Chthoniobacterales bacterium]
MDEVESQMSPEVASLSPARRKVPRRTFLCRMGVGAIALAPGAALFSSTSNAFGEEDAIESAIRPGDAALLRFAAALEIIEADFWIQYNELGGIQDSEVPGGSGNPDYTEALEIIEDEMGDYIHDNTDDEITHHRFLNAYLVSKGAAPANLGGFRTVMGSTATGVNPNRVGKRLTNLTQLTLDTSWWTRYRDDAHNPDLDPNHVFPQAVPSLHTGQHTAIPRTDNDLQNPKFVQAMANTAAFHFPTIEQGGNSLYPSMAQRATSVEVLRILISIGPTETMHFQTWSDVAGNAPPLSAVDPVTGVRVTFPDLEVENELFDKALIMPEPCPFLHPSLPICSVIRPTNTEGAATGALAFLTAMGLFIGQSQGFFAYMKQLAQDADSATRG